MKRPCKQCGKDMRSAETLRDEIRLALGTKGYVPSDLTYEAYGLCGEACAAKQLEIEDQLAGPVPLAAWSNG